MSNIQNKVIEIVEIANKNGRFTIRDQEKNLYSFFQFKTGTKEETQAYTHLMTNNHNGQFNQGDTVKIGYSESPGTSRDGQSITYKNIISIFPSEPFKDVNPKTEPTYNSSKQDQMGRRLALHGMANSRLVNHEIAEVKNELSELDDLEDSIESLLLSKNIDF